jgi:hypothetical protein
MSNYRIGISALLAGMFGLMNLPPAKGEGLCRPTLAVGQVSLSPMRPPTFERKWIAVVSVDTSRCAVNSRGTFDIVFSQIKENGPDIEFRQRFIWQAPSVTIEVDFWADEAVQGYWIDNIAPCPCGG